MTREISNPLQSLIAGAAKALPQSTGETARLRLRLEGSGSATAILADLSSSMAESAGSRTKVEVLREALAGAWPDLHCPVLIGFGSSPFQVPGPEALPAPAGGTALHLALDFAVPFAPRRTLVISDGRPDVEADALAAAGRLPGRIDVIYCGPDNDRDAIAFMHKLARIGAGTVVVRDVHRESRPQLGPAVRTVLGLPGPGRFS